MRLTFLVRCLWIDDTSARNVINPLASRSLLTSFETKIIMVYVIMARGKGLIREDSCNLCKERGMGAARTKGFVAQEFVSPGARLVFQRHPVSVPASLCIWFLERRRGAFLVSRVYRAVRSYQCFMRHLLLLGCKAASAIASFDFILAPYFKSDTRNFVHARNDRWRKNSSFVDGDVDVDESSLVFDGRIRRAIFTLTSR